MSEERDARGDLVVRELAPSELGALATVPPFDQVAGLGQHAVDHVRVIGAIRGGRIVAYWMVHDAVHVEPLWISEEERGNAGLGRALWEGVRGVLERCGAPMAYAVIGDGGLATSLPMLVRLGFKPLQGNLFYLIVEGMRRMRGGGNGG